MNQNHLLDRNISELYSLDEILRDCLININGKNRGTQSAVAFRMRSWA